jgi:hypothetical protein
MGAKGRDAGQRVTFGEYWTSASTPGVAYEFTWLGATGECCLVRRPESDGSSFFAFDLISSALLTIRSLFKERRTEGEYPTGIAVVRKSLERADVENRLDGWQDAMPQPDSATWLLQMLS